jgi:hypothetical protein
MHLHASWIMGGSYHWGNLQDGKVVKGSFFDLMRDGSLRQDCRSMLNAMWMTWQIFWQKRCWKESYTWVWPSIQWFDAFEVPISPAWGHIAKDSDENAYFSFLFIISLSCHSRQWPVHDMAGVIPFNSKIAISHDFAPDGLLMDTNEPLLL